MNYHLTPVSSNSKTGPIPVSTQSKNTCPSTCPFKEKGCYAANGPLNIHWNKITNGERGVSFEEFLKQISALPPQQLWRYGQAGDLPGENLKIDHEQLKALDKANGDRPVIIFTHKSPTGDNLKALQETTLHINLSANSLSQADEYKRLNLPVVVVVNSEYERKSSKNEWTETMLEYKERTKNLPQFTPEGHKLVVCPATWADTNCDKCRLCSHDRKGAVIGFPAHGSSKRSVNEIIKENG